MGTDNFHHRRKAKKASELGRRRAKKAPYSKVLIVCEGEKTEPLYFLEMRDDLRLSTANIEICGEECGSDPVSIVRYARRRYKESIQQADPFDKVFFVFDRDQHEGYRQAIDQLRSFKPLEIFQAVTSVPSFEYWFLLHFEYSTKPYIKQGRKSAGDQIMADLLRHLPGYQKAMKGVFWQLRDKLDTAIGRAERASRESEAQGRDNPSTNVHRLVSYLRDLAESKSS